MRVSTVIVSLYLLSTGLVACGGDAQDPASPGDPAAESEQSSADAGVTDVAQAEPDGQSSSADASASGATDVAQAEPDGQPSSVDPSAGDVAGEAGAALTLESGPDDAYSQAGCGLLDGENTAKIAASSISEAGQEVLVPNADNGFIVALPESGIGFVTLEVPDWQAVVALYTTAGVEVVIHDPQGKTELLQALSWAAPCADQEITEERTKYHEWGSFTLELRGEPGGEAWLAAIVLE